MSEVLMDCKRMPLVADTQEADVESSPEPKSSRPAKVPQEYLV